ncbi:MAG TPA: hypothetical protein VIH72_10495 [Candidatus Acidoferrales bacterium]
MQKSKTIGIVLNDKKSRDENLADAIAQGGGGILDSMQTCGRDVTPRDSHQESIHLTSSPAPRDIDYANSSDMDILGGHALLKDGRRVSW